MSMKIAARGLPLVLSGLTFIGGCILPIAAARAQDIITFGTSLSLTGALSTEAKGVKLGYDFYVQHINDLGGINVGGKKYKVAIKYYDDGSNTNTAVQLYERLINEDRIQLLLGP